MNRRRMVRRLQRWALSSPPRWVRRSMGVRVVALTLVLGTIVVLGVGQFVLNDVANRLAQRRTEYALSESAAAVQQVQESLDGQDISDTPTLEGKLDDIIARVQGAPGPVVRDAVLLRVPGDANTSDVVIPPRLSGRLVEDPVSAQLRSAVAANPSIQQAQLVSLRLSVTSDDTVPAVVVGSVVDLPLAGNYELYLVYSMEEQVATLRLVERAFVVGGIALVALIGTIAWLVARLVVTPVREAARTAEQLAAGELDRRMTVRGEDEVARLAASFNIMAASLQAQIGRLESLSRLQQRFVSDVSHELRTPLTTIRMAADVLHDRMGTDDSVDEDLLRSVVLLSTQIDRFEALLADLLEVSRFDAGAADLDVEPVDVLEIVRQCIDLTRPVADAHGVAVTLRMTGDGDARTEADPRRVSRIVRNLLSNAIEHAEGRGVDVTLAGDSRAVAIAVRDYGSGMSNDHVERVFDRFWRGDPSRRRTLGGSGLGLAISMEDARLHGGRLEVWSRPGEGANFVVTLPKRARTMLGRGPLNVRPDETAPVGPAAEIGA